VEACRYPHHPEGVDPFLPTPLERMRGEAGARRIGQDAGEARPLGIGTRGRGSETIAAAIWGISEADYRELCDPWPLNPQGELLLGVKLESSTRVCGSSPATARRPPASAAPTSSAKCRCEEILVHRDCFASLAMTPRKSCHCEERSDEAISMDRGDGA